MKIYHIKNNYMYNRNDRNGTHRYAVFKDRTSGETRVVQLTHLYEIPYNKLRQIQNGYLKKYKLSCYSLPSGVETGYKTKDINGNPISLNNLNSTQSYNLSKKDSKRIKSIAKRRIN